MTLALLVLIGSMIGSFIGILLFCILIAVAFHVVRQWRYGLEEDVPLGLDGLGRN